MTGKDIEVSIVIPFYNEEDNAQALVERIVPVMNELGRPYEIIAVDDGSRDATFDRLKAIKARVPALRVIKFRRNFGQTQAMQAGIDHARGDIIVTMDGDLQNDPVDIPALLDKMAEGYEVVSGWRQKRKDSILRCIPSKVANFLLTWVTGVNIHDNGCSLKAYNAAMLKRVRLYSEMHRFIPAFVFLQGARVTEMVVHHHPRTMGESKYGFSRIWKVFIDLFTLRLILNFSERPMTWFGMISGLFLAASFLVGLFLLFTWQASIVWPGVMLLFAHNAFFIIGCGLISELSVEFRNPITTRHIKRNP